ncbi:disulfide bond formation protein B [Blastochloris tepida]|uniref:disulfide bond formation protein B n=1 Tax=Blastochloris tepida TaxID=2233851 RepID=UPI0013584410|nr:disulfide bond formation protein B [Blastochloris tepida]
MYALFRREPAVAAAVVIGVVAVAAISAAFVFQYVVGLAPCSLCYTQRIPHYLAMPIALAAVVAGRRGAERWARGGALLLSLVMAGGAVIASYHAGVEWHWWSGPASCTGDLASPWSSTADLIAQLNAAPIVPCDEPAWVFLGLSMAGWNALLSAGLAIIGLVGTFLQPRGREHSVAERAS